MGFRFLIGQKYWNLQIVKKFSILKPFFCQNYRTVFLNREVNHQAFSCRVFFENHIIGLQVAGAKILVGENTSRHSSSYISKTIGSISSMKTSIGYCSLVELAVTLLSYLFFLLFQTLRGRNAKIFSQTGFFGIIKHNVLRGYKLDIFNQRIFQELPIGNTHFKHFIFDFVPKFPKSDELRTPERNFDKIFHDIQISAHPKLAD